MLTIRLRRTGTTKKPYYRVVVADSRSWRDGKFVEIVGHYDPRAAANKVVLKADRVDHWIAKGAQPTDTVRSLIKGFKKAEKARAAA